MGNLIDATTDVKGLIKLNYRTFPLHQGLCDITEVIEFARIAEEHNLTNKQYEELVVSGEEYYEEMLKQKP